MTGILIYVNFIDLSNMSVLLDVSQTEEKSFAATSFSEQFPSHGLWDSYLRIQQGNASKLESAESHCRSTKSAPLYLGSDNTLL